MSEYSEFVIIRGIPIFEDIIENQTTKLRIV